MKTEPTENKETKKPEATTTETNKEVKNETSKKTKTPITIEFANVISALEVNAIKSRIVCVCVCGWVDERGTLTVILFFMF